MKHKKLQKKTGDEDDDTNADETKDTEFDDEESRESFTSDSVSDKAQCSKQSQLGNKQSTTSIYRPYRLDVGDDHEDEIDVVDSESEGDI
jgi:hypothetical protein